MSMANFAERIAYWYLRLNGFFLVENFVHHHRPGERQASDSDLLAVRLRHTHEVINDQEVQYDDWRGFGVDLATDNIAAIVQVKGGGGAAGTAFADDRVADAVRRIGAFDEPASARVADALGREPHVALGDWRVVKLVIGPAPTARAYHLPLAAAWDFVRDRVRVFADRKHGDWNHFPDTMIQLLAWELDRG